LKISAVHSSFSKKKGKRKEIRTLYYFFSHSSKLVFFHCQASDLRKGRSRSMWHTHTVQTFLFNSLSLLLPTPTPVPPPLNLYFYVGGSSPLV